MLVYVVHKGEQYDGDSIIGIFKSKKKARKFALKQHCCCNYKKCNHKPWEVNDSHFTTGGQYMIIEEYEVK